jgi:hypothetical protein
VARTAVPRFLIHWALRREDLCDPKLCPDASDGGRRCDHCPLDRLDAAQSSEAGLLLRRALDLRGGARGGIQIGLDDVTADELAAMFIVEDEREK